MRGVRALVPLFTAAALALGGWLAWGIVTVRSLEPPSRIGLLPPFPFLIVLVAALLALEWWAARSVVGSSPSTGRWQRAGVAAALMLPIALPWTPLTVPPALLVWVGPLAVGLWVAAVGCVHADALRRLGATGAWIKSKGRKGQKGPLLAAMLTGLALTATAWHTASQHPRGDEPDYLIVTQSLWLDGDLQIENNHARADYAAYHAGVLPPSYLQRGVNGQIYSVHAPGLPAALVPAFALGGYRGAVALLVLVAMFGAWLVWHTCWEATGSQSATWIGTLATVGSAPFFLHGAAIFPDAPASVLALLASRALMRWRRGEPVRWWGIGLALSALPWLHTRYAIIAAAFGAGIVWQLARAAAWRQLIAFAVPPSLVAAGWLAFFVVVYGTPNPSAPYGAYQQMAFAHLLPGVPGLLVDQQFGLLAAAPILGLALLALRRSVRGSHAHMWPVAVLTLALACAYTMTVAAYRMWWGGLSAPARFLVPIVLPLAPLVAVGWQSLRHEASRQLAVALLVASLAITAMLATVDDGALAYNVRDGAARWALWAGPLVDLTLALPAAHRDLPAIVVRDAAMWLATLGGAWILLRGLESRQRLRAWTTCLTFAAAVPVASTIVRSLHGAPTLQPVASQVRYLERRASGPAWTLATITPPPRGRTRTWFDVELDSRRGRGGSDFTVLRIGHLPPGRYRLATTALAPGARLGVTLGEARTERFIADLAPVSRADITTFAVPVPVAGLVVKGSREAAAVNGRTWLDPVEVWADPGPERATRTHPFGTGVWLLPDDGIYPEPSGVWLAGDASVVVGVPDAPLPLTIRAGTQPVVVQWSGSADGEARLAAGEQRDVLVNPRRGRLAFRTRGGFRPSETTPGSADRRWLGAWIAPR